MIQSEKKELKFSLLAKKGVIYWFFTGAIILAWIPHVIFWYVSYFLSDQFFIGVIYEENSIPYYEFFQLFLIELIVIWLLMLFALFYFIIGIFYLVKRKQKELDNRILSTLFIIGLVIFMILIWSY